jgi:hypothetical protein
LIFHVKPLTGFSSRPNLRASINQIKVINH